MLEPVRPEAVLLDRALCLQTFSHLLIVTELLSLSLSLSLSACEEGNLATITQTTEWQIVFPNNKHMHASLSTLSPRPRQVQQEPKTIQPIRQQRQTLRVSLRHAPPLLAEPQRLHAYLYGTRARARQKSCQCPCMAGIPGVPGAP
jgi:hypothetical protein